MGTGPSRRELLRATAALVGVGLVAGARPARAATLPAPPSGFSASTPTTTTAARAAGYAVVTDFGAVGDGGSRPLSTRYATLADAQRAFPSARSLSDELDGVAIQKATDSGRAGVFYPAGTYLHSQAIVVRDHQRHLGAGAAGVSPTAVLRNTRTRTTDYDFAQAHSFQIGDIHPAAFATGRAGISWATRPLAPITAGARSVRLTRPMGTVPLRVGDVVMVRCDNDPMVNREAVVYDAQQWNRVSSYNATTGVVGLELPVPWTIVASSADPTVLDGPTLCVNDGADYFMRCPWSLCQDIEVGRLWLDSAGFTARNGVWRGWFHDLVVVGENMLGFNALVLSTIERVNGRFSSRMIELKHSAHTSIVREVSGSWAPPTPGTAGVDADAIDIGEQSYGLTLTGIQVTIAPEDTANRRALNISTGQVSFTGALTHRGTGPQQAVWAIVDSQAPANPPRDLSLALLVRTRPGMYAYGVVGWPDPRPSSPVGVTLDLDQASSGTPAGQAFHVATGRNVKVTRIVGDRTTASWSPPGQAPTGCASVQV
ncbi:glycoside hydrolase family 55 protein [Actinomycetospora soli]|uniref:glycoside hydrolase family 55 protein n=1 Tax=Actinomycetospora soli TaxID=2893887 RepID=UPI001E30B9C2|nr:glycoside hydrolase family 55 protein [Actinomycetospora soli]MCD2187719.1 glycoside hydrolase family 55 protein [Actinomycetospora soli]